ncbi:3-dehydroshikimate dehydratase [Aspergillus udagawae]|uniref:3-dehydroshikimate dehydratase n=1 Tax=Aspergillus udagawae TaxID=91492 RepID=A0A8H3RTR5_9EURO|nr:3-dehydroshikimate dehydratase [Aspergillus udagawae]GFF39514.1 3-dehydroshikimate dehydratase [Aspergillus udagawae]GFF71792.1 3-dehydroshikimate dehydratase [Aspergillus udagawae]GFG09141.1 3-dehydroshikimate dehydratase [Aspergillus udagawae]GFG22388.1 3-dehydroshikimate dehydratase [Aspergillus udagawae]
MIASSPSITYESLRNIPLSYATCSIGSSNADTLPRKLEAISQAGFTGIELSFPDIIDYGSRTLGHQVASENFAEIISVAGEIRKLCDANNLKVMMLQPFANFEGWPRGSLERQDAFTRVNGWIEIMNVVGTDLLQVGSTDAPAEKITTDRTELVADLRELADLLAKRNMRLAYENWCWSTHAPTWKDVWEIVRAVDRPNIGLCLDTFQTAGSEWGDPRTISGRIDDMDLDELNRRFAASMDELARSIPPEKIYLLQISDAYKPTRPIEDKMINGLRPRGRWSHDFRPMPYDGGYLPIEEVTRAVLKTGFRGWFSMEIFDGGNQGKGKKYDMIPYAKNAMESMQELLKNCADDK